MVENILKSSLDLMAEGDMPPGKKKTLEAAIILFGKKGYNGTSTLEIAKAAGVSQATVFKYFRTYFNNCPDFTKIIFKFFR